MAEKKNESTGDEKENREISPEEAIEAIKKSPDRHLDIPKTLLKKEEWGLLTVMNLSLALLFPAYFVNILLISFFSEIGHFWTTHLNEKGRARVVEFEKEFRLGYEKEKENQWEQAVEIYEKLVPRYQDIPKIAS
ncbi:MAG TPA: hypothetical protein ENN55_02925, partial [Firmicutes bacterium]|nr:hypothetical protein [Bacillota bacterium]